MHSMAMTMIAAVMFGTTLFAAERMEVREVVEQRYRDDGIAVVLPDRLQLYAKAGADGPWQFGFAGFETTWRGPIEIEVTGSGNYQGHDVFSLVGLSLDFGGPDGKWLERSIIGLGFIQPHPPGWGVGGGAKWVMRENVVNANATPQRMTIDPGKYAPADWDGRLWIGVMLHNVGPSRWVSVRILNGGVQHAGEHEPDDEAKHRLRRNHEAQLVRRAIRELEAHRPNETRVEVVEAMQAYAPARQERVSAQTRAEELRQILANMQSQPLSAEQFVRIAEQHFAWRRRDESDEPLHRLNAFHEAWRRGGALGESIGCIIRTATNLEKIWLSDIAAGRIVTTPPEAIALSAARHEHEGFQLVFTPLPGHVEHVAVSVSDLRSESGGTIAASNIKINPVGYNRIGGRLSPDPLLLGEIPVLAAGENQPVWVSVYVPRETPPGQYEGELSITSPGKDPLTIPLHLTVRKFEIPQQISLRSSFWMFRDQLNRFYHLDEIDFEDYMKWIDMALEYRHNPIDVFEGRCRQLVDVIVNSQTGQPAKGLGGVANPNPDFTLWDRYIDRMVAGGANTIHLGQTHHHGGAFTSADAPAGSEKQIEQLKANLRVLAEHYKRRGVIDLHYLQLRDETSAPESLNVYRAIRAEMPELKLLLTAPSGEARAILNIPCPLTPGFDASWRDEVKRAGGEYWWYVCVHPHDPFANLFLFQEATQHRALYWQTWSYQIDGLLYWGMNFWRWYGQEWGPDEKSPTTRIPPAGAPHFCPLPEAPGDGFSMYPGPTPSQPLSSVRLEIMRDGAEDYEYFMMLDRLIDAAQQQGRHQAVVAQANAARDEAKKLVASLTDYERRPQPYLDLRDRIAGLIEQLMEE